jgi:hypothetical protein
MGKPLRWLGGLGNGGWVAVEVIRSF